MGLLSLVCLAIGVALYLEDNGDRVFLCGMFIRVGLLMGVIWLAWNQLIGLPKRISPLAIGMVIAGLFLAASRPRIFPLVAAALVASLFINGLIRRFTGNVPK